MLKPIGVDEYPVDLPDLGPDYLPPFQNYEQILADFGKGTNLGICLIPKCMSTLMIGINCFIKRTHFFGPEFLNIKITDGWKKSAFCLDDTFYHLFDRNEDAIEQGFKGKDLFVIIRDPLDRFISAYINKCIKNDYYDKISLPLCYDCSKNMSCVVENAYNNFKLWINDSSIVPSYTDTHFAPLSWSCNFRKYFKDYVLIKTDPSLEGKNKLMDKLGNIFREHNIPKWKFDRIKDETLESKTNHTTSHLEERRIYISEMYSNPFIIETLKKIYYYDYLIFGFDRSIFESNPYKHFSKSNSTNDGSVLSN